MINIKTIERPVFNPYTDKEESLLCTFEVHKNKKLKIDGATLISICSEGGVELMDWLKEEQTDDVEGAYFREVTSGQI